MSKDDIVKLVPVALLSVVMTILFGLARTYLGDIPTLISAMFMVFCFSIYVAFYAIKKYGSDHKELQSTLSELTQVIRTLQQSVSNSIRFNWILTGEQLVNIERAKSAKCNEIWIVTPDISSDTEDSPWIPAIRDNIAQGINYWYICTDQIGTRASIRGLKKTFKNNLDKCQIVVVPQDIYERFPHRHIVVYDPTNSGGEMDCYAEIDAKERDYWIQLVTAQRHEVIGRASSLIEKDAKPLSAF